MIEKLLVFCYYYDMKNNKIIIYIGLITIIVIMSLLYVFKYNSLDESIFNKKWYKYNINTGYYDVINITNDSFSYIVPSNDNESNSYDKCSKYNYNSKKKELVLNCNKKIIIKEINDNYLILNIDKYDNYYYLNTSDSLNHEFNRKFNMSINEYRKSKENVLDLIKVKTNKINEIYNSDEYSKVIFMGDMCTSIECTLSLDIIEKWINFDSNVYYIDSSSLTKSDFNNLKVLGNDFNDAYPVVYVIKNKKVVDKYKIECNGFNCSMYY